MKKLLAFFVLVYAGTLFAQLSSFEGKDSSQVAPLVVDEQTDLDAAFFNSIKQNFVLTTQAIKNRYYSDLDYGTLTAAITAAATDSASLVVSSQYSITSNTTLSGNTALIVGKSARFNVTTGDTLTISASFQAGPYQVFNLAGTAQVVFSAGSVDYVLSEWFGASQDSTNDAPEVLTALKASQGVAPVRLLGRTYQFSETLSFISNVSLIGDEGTKIIANAEDMATTTFLSIASDSFVTIKNLHIELRQDASVTVNTFLVSASQYITFENINIDSTDSFCWLVAAPSHDITFDKIFINYPKGSNNDDGIHINGGHNITISNSRIHTHDDAIHISGGQLTDTYGITITNLVNTSVSGGAIALSGSVKDGSIYNVNVSNLSSWNSWAGIFIKQYLDGAGYLGGEVYNINFDNFSIVDTLGRANYGIFQNSSSVGLGSSPYHTRFKKWRNFNFSNFTIQGEFVWDAVNLDSAYNYNFSNFSIIADTTASPEAATTRNRNGIIFLGCENMKVQNGFIGGNLSKWAYNSKVQGFAPNIQIYASDYCEITNVRADSLNISGGTACLSFSSGDAGTRPINNTVKFNSFNNPNADGVGGFGGSPDSTEQTIRFNEGYVTENQGSATIASGDSSVTVAHGLDLQPTLYDFRVNLIDSLGAANYWWLKSTDADSFILKTNIDPGENVDFGWEVESGKKQ